MWSVQPPLPIWDDILFAILLNWYHHHHQQHQFWLHKSYLCRKQSHSSWIIPARAVFSAGKTVKRSSHLVIMLATEHCKQIIFGNRKVRKDKFLFPKPNVLLITFGNERKLTIKLLVQLSISIFLLMDTTLSFVKKSTFYWGSQHGLRGNPSDDIKQYPRQTFPFTSTNDEECNPTLTFKNVTNLTWLLHDIQPNCWQIKTALTMSSEPWES